MTRLMISVEGDTELEFVKQCLAPYLQTHGIFIAHPHSMNGNISLDRIASILNPYMRQFDIVTTLYDFYGFKKKGTLSHQDITQKMAERITFRQDRFIPYVQKHEFEGLLFSEPKTLMSMLTPYHAELKLEHEIPQLSTPEDINDSPLTAPSKQLLRHFRGYDKKLNGSELAQAIGIPRIREKCPLFSQWIDDIIALHQHIAAA